MSPFRKPGAGVEEHSGIGWTPCIKGRFRSRLRALAVARLRALKAGADHRVVNLSDDVVTDLVPVSSLLPSNEFLMAGVGDSVVVIASRRPRLLEAVLRRDCSELA